MGDPAAQETSDVRHSILETGQRIMAGKGFSAVGLNEILTAAGVPKGSFYHYFGSKDAFGEALLENYFEDYLANLDEILCQPDLTMAQRLMNYFCEWQETQSFFNCQGKCLAVKLGAEVARPFGGHAFGVEARNVRDHRPSWASHQGRRGGGVTYDQRRP